jgi:hypothetical protein
MSGSAINPHPNKLAENPNKTLGTNKTRLKRRLPIFNLNIAMALNLLQWKRFAMPL